jgi:hypothetical protein
MVTLTTPPSDDAQVYLLGRGPGPLSFRSGGAACGGALSGTFRLLLCKDHRRFFPINTAAVVFFKAATALRLFPRASNPRRGGAPTHEAPGRVSAVLLRVCEALTALALKRPFWNTVRFHRHLKAAEFVVLSHFRHLRPTFHRNNEMWGWRAALGGVLVGTPVSNLHDSLDTYVQGFDLLPNDALRHTPTQVLLQKPHQRSSGSPKV